MFGSYIKVAFRNLLRNKLYAAINIVGLAVGLAIYLFSTLITDYERNHDHMFENRDNTYTVSSIFNPAGNYGTVQSRAVYTGLAPLVKVQMPELLAVARSLGFEGLLRAGERTFYQDIKYVDPDFLTIFNFNYLHGSPDNLIGTGQVVVSDTLANKFFGRTNVVGETITLKGQDNDLPFEIVAVIKDVGLDSHFNSVVNDSSMKVKRSLSIFGLIGNTGADYDVIDVDTNMGWLNEDFMTYLMTDGTISAEELNNRVNGVFHGSREKRHDDTVIELKARTLDKENLNLWYSVGMPVLETISFLGVMILLISMLNYTNLATVQNIRRFREVGLRKTLGATRRQLLVQFLIECQLVAFVALILSLALIELAVPAFNTSLNKILVIDYMAILPWLIATSLTVGLMAGIYPAIVITNSSPSDAIRNKMMSGAKGAKFRNTLIGLQFVISIILLAMVFIVFEQNRMVREASDIFPKSLIMNIGRISKGDILSRTEALEREIQQLPDVEHVAWSTQVPFEPRSWLTYARKDGMADTEKQEVYNMMSSHDFLKTYDIPIVAGRDFDPNIIMDDADRNEGSANVIINETMSKILGFRTPADAVNQIVLVGSGNPVHVIGVMEDRNFQNLQTDMKPYFTRVQGGNYDHLSIKLKAGTSMSTISDIESIWNRINPDYPMDWAFLDASFEKRFGLMRTINAIFIGFSVLAIALALFGLFGLAAFLAKSRTKEIGIRKVLGATVAQIARLLVWQFSRPVFWAILLAVPIAWFAADMYLQFFANRITTQVPIILVSGMLAVVLAWAVVAGHAINVARANPIKALRYE